MWKSTSESGAAWPRWLHRAMRNRHRHAIEQASRRWRGSRRNNSERTRRKILILHRSRAALVGPSGGGKTTLLHLLERFYDVDSGRILFDGIDVRAVEPTVLRTKMALVAQQPALFSGSSKDNIAYASTPLGAYSQERIIPAKNAKFDFKD